MEVLASIAVIVLCTLIAVALYLLVRGNGGFPRKKDGGHVIRDPYPTDPSGGHTQISPVMYVEQLDESCQQVVKRFPLGTVSADGLSIGRSDAHSNIRLSDAVECARTVSQLHARIGQDHLGYFLQDAGSTNGTYVDGNPNRIDEVNITDGLIVYLGDQPIRFTFRKRFQSNEYHPAEEPQRSPTGVMRRRSDR